MRSLKFFLPVLQSTRETMCHVTLLAGAQVSCGVVGTGGSYSVKPVLLEAAASVGRRPQVLAWLKL